jgi:hypothetical protein
MGLETGSHIPLRASGVLQLMQAMCQTAPNPEIRGVHWFSGG